MYFDPLRFLARNPKVKGMRQEGIVICFKCGKRFPIIVEHVGSLEGKCPSCGKTNYINVSPWFKGPEVTSKGATK